MLNCFPKTAEKVAKFEPNILTNFLSYDLKKNYHVMLIVNKLTIITQ